MSTRQKWFVRILIVFLTCSHFYEVQAEAKYLFHQQFNDMCMVAPMLNLPLVEKFCSREKLPAYTRREWFVKSYDDLRVWHRTLSDISGTALSRYLDDAIENGPIMPHFYDQDGKIALKKISPEAFLIPYLLIDYNPAQSEAEVNSLLPCFGLRYPFVLDYDDHYKVFFDNKSTGKIEMVDLGIDFENAKEAFKTQWLAHYEGREPYIEFDPYYWAEDKKSLGFKKICVAFLGTGYPHNGHFYLPYMYGLYKLMLLRLGLNNQNKEMSSNTDKDLFPVHEDLNNRFEKDPLNPWHSKFFTKDKFLQYAIAEIFKSKPELFEQAKETIDFHLRPWKLYHDLKYGGVYYKINRDLYTTKDVDRFLPGDEQMMASMVTLSVRLLLYGACSHGAEAFYKTTNTKVPGIWEFDIFKEAAIKKKTLGSRNVSFIDTWQEIVSQLRSKYSNRDNWISFDDHGWVASFNKHLLDLQSAMPGVDQGLLDKLGVAIIESWHSSEMSVFYKSEE